MDFGVKITADKTPGHPKAARQEERKEERSFKGTGSLVPWQGQQSARLMVLY
jgi:hypothetical protein